MTTAPPILENQLQHDRMARAQAALMNGDMQVIVLTDCTWTVASKSSHYTVSLDGKAYNHADAGRCIFTGDTPEALDMAIAGAVISSPETLLPPARRTIRKCLVRQGSRQDRWPGERRFERSRTIRKIDRANDTA